MTNTSGCSFGVLLGIVVPFVPVGVAGGESFPTTPPSRSAPGRTVEAKPTLKEAQGRLEYARWLYDLTVDTYGHDSAEAAQARQRLNEAEATYATAQAEDGAAVRGGAGRSSGEKVGMSRTTSH